MSHSKLPGSLVIALMLLAGLSGSSCLIHGGGSTGRSGNKLVGAWEGVFIEEVPNLNLTIAPVDRQVRWLISRIEFTRTEFLAIVRSYRDSSHFIWTSGTYERAADTLLLTFKKTDVGKYPYGNPVPFAVYVSDSLLHIECIPQRKVGDSVMLFPLPGFLWDHTRLDGGSSIFGPCACEYRRLKSP